MQDQPAPHVEELAIQAPNSAGIVEDPSQIPPPPAVDPRSEEVDEDTFVDPEAS